MHFWRGCSLSSKRDVPVIGGVLYVSLATSYRSRPYANRIEATILAALRLASWSPLLWLLSLSLHRQKCHPYQSGYPRKNPLSSKEQHTCFETQPEDPPWHDKHSLRSPFAVTTASGASRPTNGSQTLAFRRAAPCHVRKGGASYSLGCSRK